MGFFFFEPNIAAERFPIWQVCSVLDQNQLIKLVSGNAHQSESSIVIPECVKNLFLKCEKVTFLSQQGHLEKTELKSTV